MATTGDTLNLVSLLMLLSSMSILIWHVWTDSKTTRQIVDNMCALSLVAVKLQKRVEALEKATPKATTKRVQKSVHERDHERERVNNHDPKQPIEKIKQLRKQNNNRSRAQIGAQIARKH